MQRPHSSCTRNSNHRWGPHAATPPVVAPIAYQQQSGFAPQNARWASRAPRACPARSPSAHASSKPPQLGRHPPRPWSTTQQRGANAMEVKWRPRPPSSCRRKRPAIPNCTPHHAPNNHHTKHTRPFGGTARGKRGTRTSQPPTGAPAGGTRPHRWAHQLSATRSHLALLSLLHRQQHKAMSLRPDSLHPTTRTRANNHSKETIRWHPTGAEGGEAAAAKQCRVHRCPPQQRSSCTEHMPTWHARLLTSQAEKAPTLLPCLQTHTHSLRVSL